MSSAAAQVAVLVALQPARISGRPRLKVCGLTRVDDVVACVELGVDAIGINLWSGSRRGLDLAGARALVERADAQLGGDWGQTARVGVFVGADVAQLRAASAALGLAAVQVHDDRDVVAFATELASDAAAPGAPGIAAEPPAAPVHAETPAWVRVIRGTPALDGALRPAVAIPPVLTLLDAWVPGHGGAGQTTDWAWAARAAAWLRPPPVWLAGGIRPDNAAEALATVAPDGLDVASGAEIAGASRGEKDRGAIAALVRICNNSRAP